MKKIGVLSIVLCLVLGLVGCGSSSSGSSANSDASSAQDTSSASIELNISAAASLQEAMVEVEQEFKKVNPDVKLTVNLGASGALMQQIQEGAPCDVFISAGAKQMEQLVTDGVEAESNKSKKSSYKSINELVLHKSVAHSKWCTNDL